MVGLVIVLGMQQAQTYSVVGRLSVINGRNRLVWMLGQDISFDYTVQANNSRDHITVHINHYRNGGLYEDPDGVAALMAISLVIDALFVSANSLWAACGN